jgi:hypothetical protein
VAVLYLGVYDCSYAGFEYSVLDDAEQQAGAYDFYIFTGGTSEMILGGKIAKAKTSRIRTVSSRANTADSRWGGRQNLQGETRRLAADSDTQPKPDPATLATSS